MSDAPKPETSTADDAARSVAVRRGSPLAGVPTGLMILAVGVGAYFLGQYRSAPPRQPAPETARPARERPAEAPAASRERQAAARLITGWRGEPFDPLAAADFVERRFEPIFEPPPPFDAVDSILIDTLDKRIRLAHARAVPREETCRDVTGRRYACGLESRAALQNHILGKTLVCRRLFLGDPEKTGILEVRCSVDGEDLALRQIRAGWATPSDLAEPEHLAAFEEARRARRGVWAGPWEIPVGDPSEADARAVGFGTLRIGGDPVGKAAAKPSE